MTAVIFRIAILLTTMAGLPVAALAAPSLIFVHQDATDPEDAAEGWTRVDASLPGVLDAGQADIEIGPVDPDTPCAACGLTSWGIDDRAATPGSSLRYERVPSPQQVVDADALGWVLRVRVRIASYQGNLPGGVDPVDAAVMAEYREGGLAGQRRFRILFGARAGGLPVVSLAGTTEEVWDPVILQDRYRLYELIHRPDLGAATLFVDGVEEISNYQGEIGTGATEGVAWGSDSDSGLGRGHFHRVEWEIGLPACFDGLDNDGDGVFDLDDPSCMDDPFGATEDHPTLCDDGLDNDGDGAIDLADVSCLGDPTRDLEDLGTACDDQVDNDGDGDADLADSTCAGDPRNVAELTACDDGLDNDGDGWTDLADAGCLADVARNDESGGFVVNSTLDKQDADGSDGVCETDVPGECTLRAAIMQANALPPPTGVQLPSGDYDVDLGPPLGFTTGAIYFNRDVVLIGEGAAVSRIGPATPTFPDAILRLGLAGHIQISGVTIRGGMPSGTGAGIDIAAGDLTLSDSTITGNAAGANAGGLHVGGRGTTKLIRVRIEGNSATYHGGGLMSGLSTTVELIDSTVSGNTAELTGGLMLGGTSFLSNSTVSANTATTTVPGNSGTGGARFQGGKHQVSNTTFSGNVGAEGGGIMVSETQVTLTNITSTDNTPNGICTWTTTGVPFVENSIVAGNNGMNCGFPTAPPTSLGHNLSDDASCPFTAVGDLQNLPARLGPLADNGGPTRTHLILSGSPAVDAGDNAACPSLDQTGRARPQDGDGDGQADCDIGAVEVPVPEPSGGLSLVWGSLLLACLGRRSRAEPVRSRRWLRSLLFASCVAGGSLLSVLFAPVAMADGHCGRPGQRACCLLEGPTGGGCEAGAIEVPRANSGVCSGFNPFGIQASGVCVAATPCGGANQRACCLFEAGFGACRAGLIEEPNANSGYCSNSSSGIQSSGICRAITPCGGDGQRACCLGEAGFGACRSGLVEIPRANSGQCGNLAPGIQSSGVCEAIAPCGGAGQRACCLGEAGFGACRSGLVETPRPNSGQCGNLAPGIQSSGVCKAIAPCGGAGQRACCLGEARFGACMGNLNEHPRANSGQCGNLAPGIQSSGICQPPSTLGAPCGPLFNCEAGLFCDPFAGFTCVTSAGIDEPCGPGVPCEDGLRCSLALRCSAVPAQLGQTCDATSPCGDGLFCGVGLPQRCYELKKPGEGCSAFNPCVPEASCDPCLVEGCNAPLQCNWNSNNGAISEAACRTLYSPDLQAAARDTGLAMTYAAGNEIGGIVGESQSFGVSYGPDGRYGCFTSLCGGLNADVSIEAFASVGFYDDFDAVGGLSFANFQEVEILGVLNFGTSQIFARTGVLPAGPLIGTDVSFGIGISPDLLPFSAGSFLCETVLDRVMIEPDMQDLPRIPARPSTVVANGGLRFDLEGWFCSEPDLCSRSDDDAFGLPGSGSAEVISPRVSLASAAAERTATLASACVSVTPAMNYDVSAWMKSLGARPGIVSALWYGGLECEGLPVRVDRVATSPADDLWRAVSVMRRAPGNAQSFALEISAEQDEATGRSSTSRLDVVMLSESEVARTSSGDDSGGGGGGGGCGLVGLEPLLILGLARLARGPRRGSVSRSVYSARPRRLPAIRDR